MVKIDITKTYGVFGKANSGKTTFIKVHLEQLEPRDLWIFDYNRYDYIEWLNTEANLWLNETGTPEEAQLFMEAAYSKKVNPDDQREQPRNEWTFVVLEEADNYIPRQLPGIKRFVNTARNRNIGFIVSAKRPKSVPPIYRTRFDFLVVFHSTLPEDIDYITEWMGYKIGSPEHTEIGALMRSMEQGEYFVCDLNNGAISEVMKLDLGKQSEQSGGFDSRGGKAQMPEAPGAVTNPAPKNPSGL